MRQQSVLYPPLKLEMIMTGPKDSSFAMYMWSSTLVNTVGSKKNPALRTKYSRGSRRGVISSQAHLRNTDNLFPLPHLVAAPVCLHR